MLVRKANKIFQVIYKVIIILILKYLYDIFITAL